MGSDLALLLFGSKSQSKRYGWCGGCCGAGGGLSVYCQASLGAGAQKPRYFPCQHRAASGRGAMEPMGWKLLKIFPYVPLIGLLTTC